MPSMSIDTSFLSVDELAAGYRSGAFTPEDVCRQAQARLALLEPMLNAFIDPMTDHVLEQARRATKELEGGVDRGPLHGIPVAVKDMIDVAGTPTTYATRAVPPLMATTDAECVRLLKQAGAIIFGKTNLLEFAAGVAHPEFGQTNNPRNPALTAGGSSGGSAAAVAAGIVPLAIGTDTGGSVRAPASYCGIAGFKPSFGALPLQGVHPLAPSLDHLGLLARNVRDVATAFALMGGKEPGALPEVSSGTLRLGIAANQWNHRAVRPDVRSALDATLEVLRAAGILLVNLDLHAPEEMATALLAILMPEAALVHRETIAVNPEGYAVGTLDLLMQGMSLPAVDYLEAKARQSHWRDQLGDHFSAVDAIIAPTVPFVAPGHDPALSTEGDEEILSLTHANLTGAPSISINCSRGPGLPVGLQITGPVGGDAQLLAIAIHLQAQLREVPA
jgi:aspartyl-tRNA(Asn)/glutamyl-tRNA(Gln) amidotransferase subunit A